MADAESQAMVAAQAFYDAVNDGELEDASALLAEDVRWTRPPDVPLTGTIEGRAKVEQMWRSFQVPMEGFRIDPTQLRDLGEGALAHVTFSGTYDEGGKKTPFEFSGAQTFRVGEDGLISEIREFKTIPEGEADLG